MPFGTSTKLYSLLAEGINVPIYKEKRLDNKCIKPIASLMGRMKGFEPSSDGATIRCVNHFTTFAMAGDARVELALTVLETGVLPLYESPIDCLYIISKINFYCKCFG